MATYRFQKSRSTLPSRVQLILTGALTHYQLKTISGNWMSIKCAFRWDIRTRKTCTTRVSFSNYTCLLDAWLSRTWKCSSQRKFGAGFAKKLRNQFCGRGRSQALLRLRCVFRWFIWLKNINIDQRWFLQSNSKFFLHNEKVIGLVK